MLGVQTHELHQLLHLALDLLPGDDLVEAVRGPMIEPTVLRGFSVRMDPGRSSASHDAGRGGLHPSPA